MRTQEDLQNILLELVEIMREYDLDSREIVEVTMNLYGKACIAVEVPIHSAVSLVMEFYKKNSDASN